MLLQLTSSRAGLFEFLAPLVDTDSVMCTAIYVATKLCLTQLPDDRLVRET